MEVKITYDDIITRCEQLSAFEARGKVDAQGQSRFLDIHIGEVDTILIKQYITQARALLEERFERMILDTSEESHVREVAVNVVVPDDRDVRMFRGYFDGGITTEDTEPDETWPVGYFTVSDSAAEPAFLFYSVQDSTYFKTARCTFGDYLNPNGDKYIYKDETTGITYSYNGVELVPYIPKTENRTKYITEPYSFTWLIRTDTRWNGISTFTKHVNEAITSYVMAQWLSGRLDERVAFYDNLFNSSLTMAAKNIFTKTAP